MIIRSLIPLSEYFVLLTPFLLVRFVFPISSLYFAQYFCCFIMYEFEYVFGCWRERLDLGNGYVAKGFNDLWLGELESSTMMEKIAQIGC